MTADSNRHLTINQKYVKDIKLEMELHTKHTKQSRHKHANAKSQIELYILKCCLWHCTPSKENNILYTSKLKYPEPLDSFPIFTHPVVLRTFFRSNHYKIIFFHILVLLIDLTV